MFSSKSFVALALTSVTGPTGVRFWSVRRLGWGPFPRSGPVVPACSSFPAALSWQPRPDSESVNVCVYFCAFSSVPSIRVPLLLPSGPGLVSSSCLDGKCPRGRSVWPGGLPLASVGSGVTPASGLAVRHCLARSSVLLR